MGLGFPHALLSYFARSLRKSVQNLCLLIINAVDRALFAFSRVFDSAIAIKLTTNIYFDQLIKAPFLKQLICKLGLPRSPKFCFLMSHPLLIP